MLVFHGCRSEKMYMHRSSRDSSSGLKRDYKEKEVLNLTPLKEYPTVNLHEDSDIHFSSAPNGVIIERPPEFDHVIVEERKDGAEGVHASQCAMC